MTQQDMTRQSSAQQKGHSPVYSGDKVRGADIVLRKPWERGVFIAGLAGALIVGLALAWFGW